MFAGRLVLVFAALVFVAPDTSAHDSWIYGGGYRNAAGEWCCGEGDCFVILPEQVKMGGDGYLIFGVGKSCSARPSPARRRLLALQAAGRHAAPPAPPPAT